MNGFWNRRRPEADGATDGFEFGRGLERPDESGREGVVDPPAPGRLEQLFDANTEGPGIWKWRQYFDAYERHLAKFVGRGPRLVEIGVYSGGSLGMWREYFGEGSEVIGIDIEEACRAYEAPGIEIVIGDQGSPEFWAAFNRDHDPVDIVIDDGGHEPHQQVATLEALLPRLRPGGVFVCEDAVGTENEFQAYIDGLGRNLHAAEWLSESPATIRTNALQSLVHSIHRYPFLVAIERNAAPVEELTAPRHGTEWQPFFGRDDET